MNDQNPILTARQLSKHYQVSRGFMRGSFSVKALNNVSFELARGKTLAGLVSPVAENRRWRASSRWSKTPVPAISPTDGIDIATAGKDAPGVLRPKVQMVFQSPYASLNPRKQIGTMLDEPLLLNTPLDAKEREERVRATADHGRPAPRALPPLPAHVLRRPVPAHRDCPRHDPEPADRMMDKYKPFHY